jgi:putative glycerol-1-phosphate prenyltransferase
VAALFEKLLGAAKKQGGGFLLLLDPDRTPERDYLAIAEAADECGVDAILIGSSFVLESRFADAVRDIKSVTPLPVIIFPGSAAQITPHADAILFTSLLSGRNPQYLIDEQVKGAPLVKNAGLEVISCGYLLIDSGGYTSVQFMSSSFPIPRTKLDIACAHALAAQYLGMRTVYLEAGSGARLPVPEEMIQAVASYIDIPVIVGGGLTTPEECASRIGAGATFVVVGNHLERDNRIALLRELASAAHPLQPVRA